MVVKERWAIKALYKRSESAQTIIAMAAEGMANVSMSDKDLLDAVECG